ncbi:WD40-repeat-containing domain protein [Gongronella butleri]|nr:WD40-repeat-containing domain protein [Gongronella butleri]
MATLAPLAQLKGHTAPVLCLAHQKDTTLGQNILASGAEDNTCRLWDMRTQRVAKGIKGLADPVTSIAFGPADTALLYLSSGTKVLTYDLRQPGIILTEAQCEYNFSSDEINSIDINKKHTFLATGDDEGAVNIVDLATHKLFKKQIKSHDTICMAVKFSPRKAWEVWSGGSDSKMIQRDFSKGRPLEVFGMADLAATSEQMFNPPFVYTMDTSADGDWLAAGLGDASIQLFRLTDGKRRPLAKPDPCHRLQDGHSYMVNCLSFVPKESKDDTTRLISGSANGSLALWTFKEDVPALHVQHQLDPASMTRLNAVMALPTGDNDTLTCAAAGLTGAQGEHGVLNIYQVL